jgi:hypothetical protein
MGKDVSAAVITNKPTSINKRGVIKMQISDSIRQKMHEALTKIDVKTLYITDNPRGNFFPVSTYFPELAVIIMAILINATEGRSQKLTVSFDDCTANTNLNSSKRLENPVK